MSPETLIKQHFGQFIQHKKSIGTGLFEAYKITLETGKTVFLKSQSSPNNQLINEARELNLLGKTLHTPKVLGSDELCLILEWIDEAHNPNMQSQMGFALAKCHQSSRPYFGFEFDNKIGTTPQLNAVGKNISNWAEFYWQYRLSPQIERAYRCQLLEQNDYRKLLKIRLMLPDLLTDDIQPSLLHGDLWSGNVLSGREHPYFIDSASYFGHREIDFALTFMFGGFSPDFYRSYRSVYPLDAGFNQRKPLYMLYHYLNHLNIFGGDYRANVRDCYGRIDKLKRAGQTC
jgi:fructosamine-3-kinase